MGKRIYGLAEGMVVLGTVVFLNLLTFPFHSHWRSALIPPALEGRYKTRSAPVAHCFVIPTQSVPPEYMGADFIPLNFIF
ncbi:hypothetical protein FKM82_014898 [Ascaphus truei]